MRYGFSEADETFAREVRGFLADALPGALARKVRLNLHLDKEDYVEWERVLARRNWLAAGWPSEHGGPGFTPTQRYLFERESGAVGAPRLKQFGIGMAGPVIYTYGNAEQRERFLPAILESRHWWCQGFSEPGAGSDLASLATRAVRRGDHYVVSGQKTWTTYAQWADWMFCLVRTDPAAKPQAGISFLLIDMKSPGITIRPIRTIDGSDEFNEVFLDEVRVPIGNRVGEENRGWTYAKFLLAHERFGMSNASRSRRLLQQLRSQGENGGEGTPCGRWGEELAGIDVALSALELMELRMLSAMNSGREAGSEAAKLKLLGSAIAQRLSRLRFEMAGAAGLVLDKAFLGGGSAHHDLTEDGLAGLADYLNNRKLGIWGGSSEVQKSILARTLLDTRG